MRKTALALIALAIAFPAAAQTTVSNQDQLLENRVWAEQQLSQQQAAAASREAYVAQQRAQTAATIADLNARNAAMLAQSQAQPPALAPLNPDIAAADAAMAKGQARILAGSKARILQVTGGSR